MGFGEFWILRGVGSVVSDNCTHVPCHDTQPRSKRSWQHGGQARRALLPVWQGQNLWGLSSKPFFSSSIIPGFHYVTTYSWFWLYLSPLFVIPSLLFAVSRFAEYTRVMISSACSMLICCRWKRWGALFGVNFFLWFPPDLSPNCAASISIHISYRPAMTENI